MRKLEQFWFRYFSEATLNTEDGWVRYLVAWIISIPAIIAVGMNVILGGTAGVGWILIYSGILVVFGGIWITVYFYHNWRLDKEVYEAAEEPWSDCCSAPIINGDLCSECGEHI